MFSLEESTMRRVTTFYFRVPIIWNFSFEKKHQDKLIEKVHSFTAEIISQQREKFLKNGNIHTEYDERTDVYGIKEKKSFLDILLQTKVDGKPLSDLDIREEVDTFIFEVNYVTRLEVKCA